MTVTWKLYEGHMETVSNHCLVSCLDPTFARKGGVGVVTFGNFRWPIRLQYQLALQATPKHVAQKLDIDLIHRVRHTIQLLTKLGKVIHAPRVKF